MILNIAAYRFVEVNDPETLVARLHELAESQALLGTILIAREGLNLFLAGPDKGIECFVDGLRTDPRFTGIVVKRSYSKTRPFARLKARVKPEIISFRQPDSKPLAGRAPAVEPEELARWIANGEDDQGNPLILLDTRNQQEVAFGSFAGAMTLPINKFTELPAAISERRDALEGATVVSFCTGGIRCEKAALWMKSEGFANVFQLDGGILGYFEQVGGYGYEGRCFVFDERIALDSGMEPLEMDRQHP